MRGIARLVEFLDDPAAGVRLVAGYEVHRGSRPELDWALFASDASEATPPAEFPAEITSVVRATMPLVDTSYHLDWLRRAGLSAGVEEVVRRIDSVDEAHAYGELAVLATGLGTNDLVPDAGPYPIRGQVLRVANPGGVPWLIDDRNPDGLLYVIPRIDEVVALAAQ